MEIGLGDLFCSNCHRDLLDVPMGATPVVYETINCNHLLCYTCAREVHHHGMCYCRARFPEAPEVGGRGIWELPLGLPPKDFQGSSYEFLIALSISNPKLVDRTSSHSVARATEAARVASRALAGRAWAPLPDAAAIADRFAATAPPIDPVAGMAQASELQASGGASGSSGAPSLAPSSSSTVSTVLAGEQGQGSGSVPGAAAPSAGSALAGFAAAGSSPGGGGVPAPVTVTPAGRGGVPHEHATTPAAGAKRARSQEAAGAGGEAQPSLGCGGGEPAGSLNPAGGTPGLRGPAEQGAEGSKRRRVGRG